MANTKITNPELFNLGASTSATQLPVMTTTDRIAMNAVPTFNIDYLVVAGGGGGGGSNYGYTAGGGGGAGGLLTNVGGTSLSLATGGSGYTITVGDGGIIGTPTSNGGNGYNSLFYNITSIGGSGGGSAYPSPTSPSTGGSGGGSNAYANTPGSGTPNQGFAGGTAYGSNAGNGSGGGGGSSAVGANGLVSAGGNGGNGTTNAITVSSGTGPYYAGGGGGGQWLWQYSGTPTPGTGGTGGGGAGGTSVGSAYDGNAGSANTGGGGGGGSAKYTDGPVAGVNGGLGGSGIVILRFPTADIASYTTTGISPTVDTTTVSGQTILSFTTVGTGTITFTSPTPTGTISTGEMIFNSDTDKVEYWDGTKWYGITYEVIYPTSLNMFLKAGNTTSYPRNGTTWFDLTSNANNGAISGASFSSLDGGYFSFDGSNDFVNTGSSTTKALPMSVEMWINPGSSFSPRGVIYSNYDGGTVNGFFIRLETSGKFSIDAYTKPAGTYYFCLS